MDFQDQRQTWRWPILERRTDQASPAKGEPAGLILESRPMPILESAEAHDLNLRRLRTAGPTRMPSAKFSGLIEDCCCRGLAPQLPAPRSLAGALTSVESSQFNGGPMTNPDETAALVSRVETVLKRLEVGNTEFPGACAACLQDVASAGHLPSCYLAGALDEVRTWRVRALGS
jgi:hypothetical protein